MFSLSNEEKLAYLKLLEEKERREKTRKMLGFYPDKGPLRRELYPKHMEFFKAGLIHQERGAIAGNRTGKTIMSSFETTCHLTGRYPTWWPGFKFNHPVDWWAASDTTETTRDILQLELMGPINNLGTGMIPQECIIGEPSRRRGIADAIDTVTIKHVSGGQSVLGFKSYDQGREKFQGTKKHGISLDEEPSVAIYFECLMRLMTTNGLMIATFTPLLGMSDIVLSFLNNENLVIKEDDEKNEK